MSLAPACVSRAVAAISRAAMTCEVCGFAASYSASGSPFFSIGAGIGYFRHRVQRGEQLAGGDGVIENHGRLQIGRDQCRQIAGQAEVFLALRLVLGRSQQAQPDNHGQQYQAAGDQRQGGANTR